MFLSFSNLNRQLEGNRLLYFTCIFAISLLIFIRFLPSALEGISQSDYMILFRYVENPDLFKKLSPIVYEALYYSPGSMVWLAKLASYMGLNWNNPYHLFLFFTPYLFFNILIFILTILNFAKCLQFTNLQRLFCIIFVFTFTDIYYQGSSYALSSLLNSIYATTTTHLICLVRSKH